jgi:hypothetical protein
MVNVVTNSFEAETGLAGGAAISVQTKSGTNEVHGAAFLSSSRVSIRCCPPHQPDHPK